MALRVTRSAGVTIKPSESCPSGTLNLSFIDRMPGIQSLNPSVIYVFKYGQQAPGVLKEALSKVLVPYYPLAGRLKESSHGEFQVACTGEGAWFIEASANYSLDSVNYFDNAVSMNLLDDLLPTPPPESYGIDPLVQFQVTQFYSEGFVICCTFCHSLFDGIGLAQFLNAIGEVARGFMLPSIAPVWLREAIPSPAWLIRALGAPQLPPQPAPTPCFQLEHASVDIYLDEIKNLKEEFLAFTGEHCSTFDVVVASLWQNRTRAIGFDQDTKVNLGFTVNTRRFLDPPMQDGYYGNCVYRGSVTVTSGMLVKASNAEVVKLIRDAKARVPTEFTKFLKSDKMEDIGDALSSPLAYTTLVITDWTMFNQVDCGWGHPVNILTAPKDFPNLPIAVLVLSPASKKGIRLITCCVEALHLRSLVQCYKNGTLS